MSDSVSPRRRQPTRLPHHWDSPGKNTGVGCHFHLQCVKMKSEVAQSCLTLHDPMDCSLPGSSVRGIFQARVLERGAIAFSTFQTGGKNFSRLVSHSLMAEERLLLTLSGSVSGFVGKEQMKESLWEYMRVPQTLKYLRLI